MQDIKLIKAVNVRDFGGTIGADGRKIKSGMLIRGAEMCYLNDRDKATLQGLGLKRMIDLRNPKETVSTPDVRVEGCEAVCVPIFEDKPVNPRKEQQTRKERREDIQPLTVYYPMFVTNDYSVNAVSKACRLLMEDLGGPQLFHCAAGKDRTGIVAACLLHMLGVSKQDIFDDYRRSNRFLHPMAARYWWGEFKKRFDFRAAAGVKAQWLIDMQAMVNFWHTAEQVYGSLDGYIEQGLRISKEEQQAFRARMLEP